MRENAKNPVLRQARRWGVMVPLLLALTGPVWGQTWKINLRDADINAFIGEVADITGKNFAVDPRVKGNITVISNRALSREEVFQLFMGVMNVNGVAAIPAGNTIKLVPDVNARQSGVPFDLRRQARGDQMVTRVIWLDNTNPNDLIPALRPLMPPSAQLAAVPGTNALIASDRAGSLTDLEQLINALDGGDNDRLEAIPLTNSRVEEIIDLVQATTANLPSRDPRGSRLRIIGDPRTNRLLVKGDARSRKKIRDIIQQLDVAPADRLGGLRVFRLQQASAKKLAEMLQGLLSNTSLVSSNPSGSLTASNSFGSASSSTGTSGTASSPSGGSGGESGSSAASLSSASGSFGGSGAGGSAGKGFSIVADESQNALVVKADPALMREIESAVRQLDVRRTQVLIQAAIVEVGGDNLDQLGVQWALGNPASGVGVINFSNAGPSLTSLYAAIASKNPTLAGSLSGALLGAGRSRTNSSGETSFYGAILQALQSSSSANLLSVPSIMTLDNEEANIVVGQNVPFITGTTTTNSGNPFNTIQRQDVGINLKVIPHVGDTGTVRLEVSQEVSAVVPTTSAVQSADIITNKRMIKTTILADDQQTIALGGLIQDDSTQSLSQVPGLGRLPLLGGLFRSKGNSQTKRNLLVFLQPTILKDNTQSGALSQHRYDQIRILQLQLDQNGEFGRLPAKLDQVYQSSADARSPVATTKQ